MLTRFGFWRFCFEYGHWPPKSIGYGILNKIVLTFGGSLHTYRMILVREDRNNL